MSVQQNWHFNPWQWKNKHRPNTTETTFCTRIKYLIRTWKPKLINFFEPILAQAKYYGKNSIKKCGLIGYWCTIELTTLSMFHGKSFCTTSLPSCHNLALQDQQIFVTITIEIHSINKLIIFNCFAWHCCHSISIWSVHVFTGGAIANILHCLSQILLKKCVCWGKYGSEAYKFLYADRR